MKWSLLPPPLFIFCLLSLLSSALVAISILHFTSFTWTHSTDVAPCEMSYFHLGHIPVEVTPSIKTPLAAADIHDSSNNKFSSLDAAIIACHGAGYRLLQYLERLDTPLGLPVLFIHGSAGNYHQARSIASRINIINHQRFGAERNSYFSVDYLEERSAFSGVLIRRQAYYANEAIHTIADAYQRQMMQTQSQQRNGKTSPFPGVIIVAHSMGGIVARLLPHLHNYLNHSILAVYTLGTPHVAPALMIDEQMKQIYTLLTQHALRTYPGPHLPDFPVLISVAGGINDYFIEPRLTSLPLPQTASSSSSLSLSLMSLSIPHVQTSIEHHALCWCKQLMEVLGHTIVDITGNLTALRPEHQHSVFTNPLAERLKPLAEVFDPAAPLLPAQSRSRGYTLQDCRKPKLSIPLDLQQSRHGWLVLMHVEVTAAHFCFSETPHANCADLTSSISSISALYADVPYPPTTAANDPSAFSVHSLLHIPYSPDLTPVQGGRLVLTMSPSTQKQAQHSVNPQQVVIICFNALPVVLDDVSAWTLAPGIYSWQQEIPAGVDRYFDLRLSSSQNDRMAAFIHFSSVARYYGTTNSSRLIQYPAEDQYISAVNVNTVVRYHRRSYTRGARALIFLSPHTDEPTTDQTYKLNIRMTESSYLRSIFLQLPFVPHLLLAAFLLLIAIQHEQLRKTGLFPSAVTLIVDQTLRSFTFAFTACCLSFALFFVGTDHYHSGFVAKEVSALGVDEAERSLLSMLPATNKSEVGIAGFILFLSMGGGLVLLFELLNVLSFLFSLCAESFIAVVSKRLLNPHVLTRLSSVWYGFLACVCVLLMNHCIHAYWSLQPVGWLTKALAFVFAPYLPVIHETVYVMIIAVLTLVHLVLHQPHSQLATYRVSCAVLIVLSTLMIIGPMIAPEQPPLTALRSTTSGAFVLSCSVTLIHPQMLVLPTLHLILLFASLSLPHNVPSFQPLAFFASAFSLLFLYDPLVPLTSFYFVYFMIGMCFLPHAAQNVAAILVPGWQHRSRAGALQTGNHVFDGQRRDVQQDLKKKFH